ncbi:hypothetical protein Ais01nite_60260 [Asanoa ishikariensis]|nr:hypothetical protein Ais01nite_60260 [Asanoa ishikariensis]
MGFQQSLSTQNFLQLVRQRLRLQRSGNVVLVDGRQVVADSFPISVDVDDVERLVRREGVRRRTEQIRGELGGRRKILLSVDRLDYTKGIEQRLSAYGELLEEGKIRPEDAIFIQVGTVTREQVGQYARLRQRVERLAGHLNGVYGRAGSPVVHYTNQLPGVEELVALYAAADIMLVTPLRDGMNLVAKEYVASRLDNSGVLILSEFAGSAAELAEALIVNPNDADELKQAVLVALSMSAAEQRRRMDAMRSHLRSHDLPTWANSFLKLLHRADVPPQRIQRSDATTGRGLGPTL